VTETWRRRYSALPEQAKARAASARQKNALIACGFTTNLDRVVPFDQMLAGRLFAGRRIDVAAPRDLGR